MSTQPLPDKPTAAVRILKLRNLINDYRYHYHVLDESIMSEAAADSLKRSIPTSLPPTLPPSASPASLWTSSPKSATANV